MKYAINYFTRVDINSKCNSELVSISLAQKIGNTLWTKLDTAECNLSQSNIFDSELIAYYITPKGIRNNEKDYLL